MQLDKDIAKIQEIKILFQDSWTQPEFFSKHLELFKFSKTSKLFLTVKESGVPFWEVMKILLVLPFIDIKLELIIDNIYFEETIGKLILYSDSLGFLNNMQIPINSTKLAS